jgi:excisionase family DNA binding protein
VDASQAGTAGTALGALPARVLLVREVADQLRVDTSTVLRLIASGQLHAHRISARCIRIPERALLDYLAGGAA